MEILRHEVCKALARSLRDANPDVILFVNAFYAVPSRQFVFEFNQNLRRTNIQFAELVALVRAHLSYTDVSQPNCSLEFSDFESVKSYLAELLLRTNFDNGKPPNDFIDVVTSYLSNKVLVEPYFGTCAVYVPPHMTIDLASDCGESGYIHSCGNLLLLRNAAKLTSTEFFNSVEAGLSLYSDDAKFMFIPYCHEDFTAHDRTHSPFLSLGLDDIELNISKAYIDGKRLSEIMDGLEALYRDRMFIAPGGNYKETQDRFREWSDGADPNTIWLITDSDVRKLERFPGERKFYILYLQKYRNHNFYQLFDENKPGWGSHTTLPHSLAAAMINVARPWLPKNREIRIIDPFGGSGTVYLEAQKLSGIVAESVDLSPLNKILVEDNVRFFRLSHSQLATLVRSLKSSLSAIDPRPKPPVTQSKFALRLENIWRVVADWSRKVDTDFLMLSENDIQAGLSRVGPNFVDRVLLYVSLRAIARECPQLIEEMKTGYHILEEKWNRC